MKKPKISNLKFNKTETTKIQLAKKNATSIKITINIDKDILDKLKSIASETDVPYQRLLNKLLKEQLDNESTVSQRLDNLEKELSKVKKKLAA